MDGDRKDLWIYVVSTSDAEVSIGIPLFRFYQVLHPSVDRLHVEFVKHLLRVSCELCKALRQLIDIRSVLEEEMILFLVLIIEVWLQALDRKPSFCKGV
jgi:hypothetical protein